MGLADPSERRHGFHPVRYSSRVRPFATLGLVVAVGGVGFGAGYLSAPTPTSEKAPPPAEVVDASSPKASRRLSFAADDDADAATPAESTMAKRDRLRSRSEHERREPGSSRPTHEREACDPETVEALDACVEERVELLGRAIVRPPELDVRFEGDTLNGQVGRALDQAGVAGEVEATDCSEHPCIVFGRLEGDEADMEKVERAEVLEPYDADVLTLLFWATSSEDPAAPARETGLFALSYYEDADRQEHGEDLERRIRARVMEYWNTDRPGPAD